MNYLIRVVDCKYLSEYKLILTFSDGKVKRVDLKKYLGRGVFKPLADINLFKRVKTDGHTIHWENGADLAPETLYEIGVDITPKPAKSQFAGRHYDQEHRKTA